MIRDHRTSGPMGTSAARERQPSGAIRCALAAGILFIVVVQILLLLGVLFRGARLEPLNPGDTIALLAGGVTAAALSGIFLQVREARRQAEQALIDVALRADQLHAEFNTVEMREHRDRAYAYLKHLELNPGQRVRFANSWVFESDPPSLPPSLEGQNLGFKDYEWSLSCMLAFYVRVATHIETYRPQIRASSSSEFVILGPFFWSYWEKAGLVALVEACEQAYQQNASTAPERPYFIDPLKRLKAIAQAAREAMGEAP